jgi:DNA-binding ferritin-like protein (Dps family)
MKKYYPRIFCLMCMAILLSMQSVPANAEGKGGMQHGKGMHSPNLIKENFHNFMKKEFQTFMQDSEAVRKDYAGAVMELRTLLSQDSPVQSEVREVFSRVRENKAKLMEMAEARGLPHHALKKALGPLADSFAMCHMMGKGKKMTGKGAMMGGKKASPEKEGKDH